MTVFIDTAVVMYAVGRDHSLKQPCAEILRRVAAGTIPGVTSAEVIQEIVHRFVHAQQSAHGAEVAAHTLSLFSPVIPITHAVVDRLPGLIARYPRMAARDLVHLATCLEEGIDRIITPDRAFDAVAELTRIDPTDAVATGAGA